MGHAFSGRFASAYRRGLRALCTAALCVGLGGCGGEVEMAIEACIDLDGPQFTTGRLPAATVGQPYLATIVVELVREPYDDDFGYEFDVHGTLPPGLQARQVGSQRRVEIAGTPTAAGDFGFTVWVGVTDPDLWESDVPALCWYQADADYRIVVDPPPR